MKGIKLAVLLARVFDLMLSDNLNSFITASINCRMTGGN